VGINRATVVLLSPSGTVLEPKEIAVSLANSALGVEPLERAANRVSEGVWRVDQLPIPRPGRWQVRIDVLVSDFEKLILEDEVELR